jgi:hypothetical protein
MPNFREFIDPNFLCNIDFLDDAGKYTRKIVTIKKVTKESIHNGKGGTESVATVHTAETKPFVLSNHNMKQLVRLTRKPNTDDWVGVRIELFISENVKAFGMLHDVIRIAPTLPAQGKSADYSLQIKMLNECKDIEALKTVYGSFTPDQKQSTLTIKDKRKNELS